MKTKSLATAAAAGVTLMMAMTGTARAGLIITGVFDGPLSGGIPKVVELFATSDIPDLSKYAAGSANNGGGTDGVELTLSGSASAGDFIYLATETASFPTYFGFTPSLLFTGGASGGPASINGDDAIELFYDATGAFSGSETVVDVFGEITHAGPGAWNYLDGWAYRNDNTGPDGSAFVIGNWSFSGINATDNQTNNNSGSIFPIGTYVPEPASLALMGLGVLMVARRR
ncbi:MAG: PEP-CTERM sorting domain-containing protein [Phycisphaerales bacterium]